MKRALFTLLSLGGAALSFADFSFTLVHTNDLHARVEGAVISKKPYGGYARHIAYFQKVRATEKNVVLLNAGDTFQGTLYFTQYKGLADLIYLNLAKYDAATLGNHEFDLGPKVTGEFVKRAQFPVVCADMDFSGEPALANLIQPSTVLNVGGQKIGVVGSMTPELYSISSPGPTIKMKDMLASVQAEVDKLTKQGINKIILLSHMGYDEDIVVAPKLHDVDLIVGGHSHSLLGDSKIANRTPDGPYPTPSKGSDGKPIYITQSWEWGKAVGHLKATFDNNGVIKNISDAKPVVMDESMPEDPFMKATIDALSQPILALRNTIISETKKGLSASGKGSGESVLGDVIADAMLAKTESTGAKIALMNAGGIRQSIEPGKISYETCIQTQPFGNTLVVLDVTAAELKAALELGSAHFLQVSKGFQVTYDLNKPEGSQVVSMTLNGAPITGTVRVVMNSFMAGGGDALLSFKNATGYRLDTGFVDVEALIDYIRVKNPVDAQPEGRIKIVRS